MIVGYARVSTESQSLDTQIAQLRAAGCTKIFQEKISGGERDRRELTRLLNAVTENDIVIVCRLDRLARSTRDLLNILHAVSDRKASFRSIGDPWADTTSPHGRLMITVLGGLAEFERSLIKSRTSEGRAKAIKDGIKFGRKPKLTRHQRAEAVLRRSAGESLKSIARSFNVSHSTISRLPTAV